jgi:hypothetical protein
MCSVWNADIGNTKWHIYRVIDTALDYISCNVASETSLASFRNYLLTYLARGAESFLKKLTGLQLVNKFPSFYGNQRFITAFTSAHHLSLS